MCAFLNRLTGQNQADKTGSEALITLLNAIPTPAVLISSLSFKILAINQAFSRMSGYPLQELEDETLDLILPEIDHNSSQTTALDILSGNTHRETILNTRSGDATPVHLALTALSSSSPLFMLTIDPLDDAHLEPPRIDYPPGNADAFSRVFDLRSGVETTLKNLVEFGSNYLQAKDLALYQTVANHPRLSCLVSSGDKRILPREISNSELFTHMTEPAYYPPFHSPTPPLQKCARDADASFLVTVPFQQHGELTGVLAAVGPPGELESPHPLILEKASHIADLAGTVLEIFEHIHNLERKISFISTSRLIDQTVSQFIPEGVITLRPDLTIQKINPTVEFIFGYASREIIDHSIDDVIIGSDQLDSALSEALRGVSTLKLDNLKLHHRDGSIFPAELQIIPVVNPATGKPLSILVIVHDVSEEEKIRLQAQQLEQRALVGQMNAIFAHEIRNPINNISSGIQLLENKLHEDDANQKVLKGLQDDCDRLTHIFDTVLNFSKTHTYQKTEIDLEQLIDRILTKWYPRMTRLDITYKLKTTPDLPHVYGDYRALVQVFTNLITNAVQAMEETRGGTLAIKLEPSRKKNGKPAVEINIFDTGPGIPEGARDRIFEPFFTTKSDGTGLGLAITKQILIEHEGNISVSHFPEGTSFDIILPAVESKE